MSGPTITAEDLALYALDLLESEEQERVAATLRASTEARKELANIRGDLALFAFSTEQHTPPALSRQRLMKQVARERRAAPIAVPVLEASRLPQSETFAPDALPAAAADEASPALPRSPHAGQIERAPALQAASPLAVPRVVSQPDPKPFLRDVPTESTEPQVFSRDPQTSPSAHSVTMFEHHFASDAVAKAAEAETPVEAQGFSRRGTNRKGTVPASLAIDAVQDRFTPSKDENFAFTSYRESREAPPHATPFSRFFAWSGWAVAAAVAVAAAFMIRDDFNVREQVTSQQIALNQATLTAARAETVMQTLQSPSSQRFVLARQDAAPAPSGRVAYLPERGTLVFQANNMEQLQPYKTYELWLIPAGEGRQPVPAGTFKPDSRGYASLVLPQLPAGLKAQNFGVTVEDEPGSSTPTLPILLVGQQS